jgi:hypothetical protein
MTSRRKARAFAQCARVRVYLQYVHAEEIKYLQLEANKR